MRRDELYLTDIIEAEDAIERSVQRRTFADFLANEDTRDAVLLRLIKIGEAAARLSRETRERYSDIPWAGIIGFRNRAVHAYFAIKWPIVWDTALENIPALRVGIADILARDYQHASRCLAAILIQCSVDPERRGD